MFKKLLIPLLFLCALPIAAQVQNVTFNIAPEQFNQDDEITITISDIDLSLWGVSDVYLWAWHFDTGGTFAGDSPTNGEWTNSSESQKFTDNGDGTYSYSLTPTSFYGTNDIGQLGMLVKAKNGDGDKKSQDNLVNVGVFQTELVAPAMTTTVLDAGDMLAVEATATRAADFELFANGASVATQANATSFTTTYTVADDTDFELKIADGSSNEVDSYAFSAVATPVVTEAPVPAGMSDGINFDPSSPTEATLVLHAPGKEFVHVLGNFYEGAWERKNDNLLFKDSDTDRFWITITNTQDISDILFQYLIDGTIRVADPYSTLTINEFNDGFIEATTFPNIPTYPEGETTQIISWIDTDMPDYEWQTTGFERPAQEDLVIYELLIRDFDALHSFDAVKDRLDYLEDLGINAIELMPVNEFDGNISWGYNPSFHMALDKYYGTPNAFKSFIDECHARGIAVILDVVYNHATGQNPFFRMYNDCGGCFEGKPTADNPYFNVEDPNTSFQFFNDLNHESLDTQAYVDRMNTYWLEEFQIDGYRFDFTKGFTNTVGDGGAVDTARIALLKRMYDELRTVDDNAYVILEHFADNQEETELINHRATDDAAEPGMLVWSNHVFNYNEATMGYNGNSDFSWISYINRGWDTPSSVGYMESHDEERLNFKNQEFGNASGDYSTKDLGTALDRLELAGAFYFTVPGPRMIWQFGELGYDYSINYCADGSNSDSCRTDPKPIAFEEGYDQNSDRTDVYTQWSRLIALNQNESIFNTSNFTIDASNANGVKRIQLTDDDATGDEIQYVTIIGNFDVVAQDVTPGFQTTGTWYNMLDSTDTIEVNDTEAVITLAPGEYKLYSSSVQTTLSTSETSQTTFTAFPNPAQNELYTNATLEQVTVFDITGKQVLQQERLEANTPLTIAGLPAGLYIMKATRQGVPQHIKFVKQ